MRRDGGQRGKGVGTDEGDRRREVGVCLRKVIERGEREGEGEGEEEDKEEDETERQKGGNWKCGKGGVSVRGGFFFLLYGGDGGWHALVQRWGGMIEQV